MIKMSDLIKKQGDMIRKQSGMWTVEGKLTEGINVRKWIKAVDKGKDSKSR